MIQSVKRNINAGFCMAAGAGAYTVNDVFVKLLAQELPVFQALFFRGVLTTAFFGLLFWPHRRALRFLSNRDTWLLTVRSLSEAAAAFFFVISLLHMPIANLTAIMFVIPLSTALFAYLVLNEPLGHKRLLAIFLGLLGILLITRPTTQGFTTWLLPIITVFAISLRDLATRLITASPPSLALSLFTSVAVTTFSLVGTINRDWAWPSTNAWAFLFGAALFIALGYALTIQSTRTGELTFIAPFRYFSLLFALIAGWLVFDEWPHIWAFAGSGLILASAVYALRVETTRSRHGAINET